MELTQEQKDRLWYVHSYEWAEDKTIDDLLTHVESQYELFYLSIIVVWETEDLRKIIDHEFCDLGLALMMYWHLDRNDAKHKLLMDIIESRVSNNEFKNGSIYFDPKSSIENGNIKWAESVPGCMLETTAGTKLDNNYANVLG